MNQAQTMILLESIDRTAISPALGMLPVKMDSPEARVMLFAIGGQESRFMYRAQKVAGRPYESGPAHGFWQMERGGGVLGVLTHQASKFIAQEICSRRHTLPTSADVWAALEHDDILAAAFARLLLFTDSMQLPAIGQADDAWDLYVRTWRPGHPRKETWAEMYANACGQVMP